MTRFDSSTGFVSLRSLNLVAERDSSLNDPEQGVSPA